MKARQKGLLPFATLAVGVATMLYCGLAMILGIQVAASRIATQGTPVGWSELLPMLGALLLFAAFVCTGFGIAGLFPSVVTTEAGLTVRHPLLIATSFKWSEIEQVIELAFPPNWAAIAISKRGSRLFGPGHLYFNYLYGLLIGQVRPVILISAGIEHRDQLVAEIKLRSGL